MLFNDDFTLQNPYSKPRVDAENIDLTLTNLTLW